MSEDETKAIELFEAKPLSSAPPHDEGVSYPIDAGEAADFMVERALETVLGKAATGAIMLACKRGPFSQRELLKKKQWSWLISEMSSVSQRVDLLCKSLPEEEQPCVEDFAASVKAALDASEKTTNAKKRALLRNALHNSWTAEVYLEGMSRRFMQILAEVEAPEVAFLQRLSRQRRHSPKTIGVRSELKKEFPLYDNHLDTFRRLGLIYDNLSGKYVPTPFGEAFLVFVSEPEPLAVETEEE